MGTLGAAGVIVAAPGITGLELGVAGGALVEVLHESKSIEIVMCDRVIP